MDSTTPDSRLGYHFLMLPIFKISPRVKNSTLGENVIAQHFACSGFIHLFKTFTSQPTALKVFNKSSIITVPCFKNSDILKS